MVAVVADMAVSDTDIVLSMQRLRDRGAHVGGLKSQAEALDRAAVAADREISLLKQQASEIYGDAS